MSNNDLDKNMKNTRKVFNDVIDEEINLDHPEDINPKQQVIKNQPVDEEVNISEDSNHDIPSPQDSQNLEEHYQNKH